jgi:hypothetical protein
MDLPHRVTFLPRGAPSLLGLVLVAWAGCSEDDDGEKIVVDAAPTPDTSPDPGWNPDTGDGGTDDAGSEAEVGEPFWTIAIIPDTQYSYYQAQPYFDSETRWIADNHAAERIAFVLHEGDIVDTAWDPGQWVSARASMRLLDGKVPYVLAVGNHDVGSEQNKPRAILINDYFLDIDVLKAPYLGGLFEPGHVENGYYLLSGGGRTWLVLSLEWSPRPAVIAWANQVLTQHANLPAILLTHAYLYSDNTRYNTLGRECRFFDIDDSKCSDLEPPGANPQCWNPRCYDGYTDGADGQMLWDSLVSIHSNVFFVFSGHVANPAPYNNGRLTSTRPDGSVCHQIMADYQGDPLGGAGYFRLVRFWPDGTVRVRTFSAYVAPEQAVLTDDGNQFTLHVELPPVPVH